MKQLVSPILIFSLVWFATCVLYSLKLSDLLVFNISDYVLLIFSIYVPFALSAVLVRMVFRKIDTVPVKKREVIDINKIEKLCILIIKVWLVLTAVEIIHYKGLPILNFYLGLGKSHFDFGISGLHGTCNSMITGCGVMCFYCYLIRPKPVTLFIVILPAIWGVLSVSRNLMVVYIAQLVIVYCACRVVRVSLLIGLVFFGLAVIILFGIVGDLRAGVGHINQIGKVNGTMTELPSGLVWAYVYITTPLNNLMNTVALQSSISEGVRFTTFSQLFPNIIRGAFFNEAELIKGFLVDDNLNVSTCFVDPFVDMGYPGVAMFSGAVGWVSQTVWEKRSSIKWLFIYSYLGQSIVFSLFYNHFLALPCIAQVIWFYLVADQSTSIQNASQSHIFRKAKTR